MEISLAEENWQMPLESYQYVIILFVSKTVVIFNTILIDFYNTNLPSTVPRVSNAFVLCHISIFSFPITSSKFKHEFGELVKC